MRIAIIGAGPAGLAAAKKASKENEVVVFDGNSDAGKKLLLTGSGRCNIGNVNNDLSKYHSSNKELIKKIINDNPILLLDDVMSELDTDRRNALIDEIKDIQTIITCTGYDEFIKEQVIINNVYSVVDGTATRVRTEES